MDWDPQKNDPTTFCPESKTILVRSDYDVQSDPHGWIVHEKIHAYLASINFKDNYNVPLVVYPNNDAERYAYTWQFVYLLEIGRINGLEGIRQIMPWKFKRYGDEWAKRYFYTAQIKSRNDDPDLPPTMIHQGGRLDSSFDLQLEEKFRKLVEEAKAKRKL